MKYNDNGTYKDIYVKAFDTLPVGAIVEYSGSTIPSGWTDIGNNQIQKTSQYIEGGAGLPSYFTTETDTGMKWIDGKPIYRKVFNETKVSGSSLVIPINSYDTIINVYGYIKVNDNGTYYEYPLNYYESSSVFVRTSWQNGQIVIRSSTGTFINGEVIVIAEYTKTTD